jgi:hypothetical protein
VDDEPIPTIPKPDALLALHDVTADLFATLRKWFAVPGEVPLDLRDVDSAVQELGDPLMIAALAMRKLQALHLLSTPGVMTTTDVVVTIVQDLDRALVQAPNMHLKLQAAATDWDAELAVLEASDVDPDADVDIELEVEHLEAVLDDPVAAALDAEPASDLGVAPVDPAQADPETEQFRARHAQLHEAVYAVLEASDGEIRYLV